MSPQDPREVWRQRAPELFRRPLHEQREVFDATYQGFTAAPPPAWVPDPAKTGETNIGQALQKLKLVSYDELRTWAGKPEQFWQFVVEQLGVRFREPPSRIGNLKNVETPQWLPGAKLNIVETCFRSAPEDTAIFFQRGPEIETLTYRALDQLSNRIANGLVAAGCQKKDRIAIDMPMTVDAVAIYLGIIKAGCAAVSIADSFAPEEIATRLRIANAKACFTQDVISRGEKQLPLYDKVVSAQAEKIIVVPADEKQTVALREQDTAWQDFLSEKVEFEAIACDPDDEINILFSSGTTGDPKAIPWTHTTALKCGSDAFFHHDARPGDVLAWPTNLGWMMGPWLIFAAMLNRASMALFYGLPTGADFCRFVQEAKVNMLGLVPSLVKAWRSSDAAQGVDWSALKCFSSTGESSNADDMFWLMSQAKGFRPVIEYCGGTEIGGGYITGTLVQPAAPATFSTPALGLNFMLLDENGEPTQNGELALIPPSMGLSSRLLNKDHHQVYFAGMPKGPWGETLRRHGDQMEALPGGYYRAHGRVDDTMNLGGIKVSSAEIERTVNQVKAIRETAAIAINPPGGGPSELVVFVVLEEKTDLASLQQEMQVSIRENLNPLFKIKEIQVVDALPRTASNKVMRRVLRDQYKK